MEVMGGKGATDQKISYIRVNIKVSVMFIIEVNSSTSTLYYA